MTSPRRAGPPQLDQKIKLRNAPTAPTISKIQPTVTRSTPDTVASTAQTRIAPAAIRSRLIPIPTSSPFLAVARVGLPPSGRNTPSGCDQVGFGRFSCSKAHLFGYLLPMGVTHEERLAQNEKVFPGVNEGNRRAGVPRPG